MATEGATVPSARVDETTSEPFFAPETVDKLQEILEKQMAEREDAEWVEFAYRSFAAGYDDDEPDYSEEDGTKSSGNSSQRETDERQPETGSAFAGWACGVRVWAQRGTECRGYMPKLIEAW